MDDSHDSFDLPEDLKKIAAEAAAKHAEHERKFKERRADKVVHLRRSPPPGPYEPKSPGFILPAVAKGGHPYWKSWPIQEPIEPPAEPRWMEWWDNPEEHIEKKLDEFTQWFREREFAGGKLTEEELGRIREEQAEWYAWHEEAFREQADADWLHCGLTREEFRILRERDGREDVPDSELPEHLQKQRKKWETEEALEEFERAMHETERRPRWVKHWVEWIAGCREVDP